MPSFRVAVVGAGYVGLTTAACLSSLGHHVSCVDTDTEKVGGLRRGRVGLHEPSLGELVARGLRTGTLVFTTDVAEAVPGADVLFLCLPTPDSGDGTTDLTALHAVTGAVAPLLDPGCVVVVKSTVPVGTCRRLGAALGGARVASNPEFLREGYAVHDFLHPSRIVVGADDPAALERVRRLYDELSAPAVETDPVSAELVKYASNCFLALKLSYANALSELCECLGGDIADVTDGMRRDPRIGGAFLRPGPGWGGSCLPKDAHALLHAATDAGGDMPLVRAALEANTHQQERITELVVAALREHGHRDPAGTRVGLLGLTFKAGTDDLRDSPALAVAHRLAARGVDLTGYDPGVSPARHAHVGPVRVTDEPYLAAKDTSALVVLTEWPEFRDLDWLTVAAGMRHPTVLDTRNHLDPAVLGAAGLRYRCLGTPAAGRPHRDR